MSSFIHHLCVLFEVFLKESSQLRRTSGSSHQNSRPIADVLRPRDELFKYLVYFSSFKQSVGFVND